MLGAGMCDMTRICVLAEKVERAMLERQRGKRRHVDAAALSLVSRPPLAEPSVDHQRVLTPWRQHRTWRKHEHEHNSEDVANAALPAGFARPPWRGTVFPPKVERPGTRALFSSATWQMDDYSRASDMSRAYKMSERRKIRSGPFRACANEDSLGQVFTRPQSHVQTARPQLTGGSLMVGYKLPALSARQPRPPATARN